jgi:hypothetical protein
MRRLKTYKGFVIAKNIADEYFVYTQEEWDAGEGYRTAEFFCCSKEECVENIDSW